MSAENPVAANSLNGIEEAESTQTDIRYKLELTPYLGDPIAKVLESNHSFDVQVVERAAPARPDVIFEVITEVAGSTLESRAIQGPRRSRTFRDSRSPSPLRVRQVRRRDSFPSPPPPRPRRRYSYTPSPPPRIDPQLENALREVEGIEELHIHQKGKTRIVIHSELLIAILRNVARYLPDESLSGTIVAYHEPYPFLMHHIDELKNVLVGDSLKPDDLPSVAGSGLNDTSLVSEARRQTTLLLDFLQPTVSEVLVPAQRLLARSPSLVTFDMLWYILAPDTMIYVRNNEGPPFAGVVTHCDRGRSGRRARRYEISYWTLTYADGEFSKIALVADIYHFPGQKEVTSLKFCPAKYWDCQDGGERRGKFLERGKRLHNTVREGPKEVGYDGESFFKNYRDIYKKDRDRLEKGKYRGRIIIDIESPGSRECHPLTLSKDGFADEQEIVVARPGEPANDSRKTIEENRAQAKNRPAFATALDDVIRVNEPSPLLEDLYVLFRPHVSGFALSEKAWMLFDIEFIQDLQASEDSLDNLVIDLDDLSIIKALSHRQKHFSKAWEADFVTGKGSGQILLLHGPPGVGKTYTVECIAAVFQRPLLVLTIADIGMDEKEMERELTKWLNLATGWGAVVLIDEADVFLEQRQTRDVFRNGLVSVFLRNIEYFRGLLFLTTNRTGQIDDAFESRLHAIIHYKRLDDSKRAKIWDAFFHKLKKDKKGKVLIGQQARKFVLENEAIKKLEWNGREIRNAFQTAVSLAEFEAAEDPNFDVTEPVVVESAHFEKVCKMSKNFKDYMFSLKKADEQKRAHGRKDRLDYDQDLD
ncbi:MAG: hypothetical protein Q9160_004136 [Pyrenula sp. 1 TL-2023]